MSSVADFTASDSSLDQAVDTGMNLDPVPARVAKGCVASASTFALSAEWSALVA